MCVCRTRIQEAFNAVPVRDGDIILIDARVIDPEQLAYLRIAGITQPISVICVLPPAGVEINLKQALTTVHLGQLRDAVALLEKREES